MPRVINGFGRDRNTWHTSKYAARPGYLLSLVDHSAALSMTTDEPSSDLVIGYERALRGTHCGLAKIAKKVFIPVDLHVGMLGRKRWKWLKLWSWRRNLEVRSARPWLHRGSRMLAPARTPFFGPAPPVSISRLSFPCCKIKTIEMRFWFYQQTLASNPGVSWSVPASGEF
jgi:hypothetical protein